MPEFLELLPPFQALQIWLDHLPEQRISWEWNASIESLGRVTSEAIISPEALPAFSRSTVDGFAVYAKDTFGASESLPGYLKLAGEIPMGKAANFSLKSGQAALIHTGGMLPEGADAVVMLEQTQPAGPGEIEILKAVSVNENILKVGEDVTVGQEILPAGTFLGPAEIGGLMALGITQIKVAKKPQIGILSSGDEVIPPDRVPLPGQVRDINSYALSALIEQCGGLAVRYGIIPDHREDLQNAFRRALSECDAVVITAGSSASTRDLTAEVINSMGTPGVLVHGVNVKPGKPTILAVCDGKAAVGLPGNPVSALVIAGLFVRPLIDRLLGLSKIIPRPAVSARLIVNLASQAGREDYIPVILEVSENGYNAVPIFFKSNLIFNLARADGLLHIPADATGLEAGTTIEVNLI